VLCRESLPFDPAFKGPIRQRLLRQYGDPRKQGWGNKWIQIWPVQRTFPWFPAQKVLIHKDFRLRLQEAFHVLELFGLHYEITSFDGCYDMRTVDDESALLSVHSWGMAVDLNAALNPAGSTGRWSPEFISVMENHGIFCGQNANGKKEPMHFALLNG
jgi:hypothetical protein